MDVETASSAEGKTGFEKALAILVGMAAMLAALLATLEVDSSKREERASLMSSRLSVGIFEFTAANGSISSFQLGTFRESLGPGFIGIGRGLASADREDVQELQSALATAETDAGDRLTVLSEAMSEVPVDQEGLDPHTREILLLARRFLEADLEELEEIAADPTEFVGEQNRQLDLAEQYGKRGSRTIFALSLLAIAAVFLGLAGVTGATRAGRVGLVAAATTLVLAAGWGASALLI